MKRPLRVAVIGAGSMGRNHARVYNELEGVELVGVADPHLAAARSVARRYKVSYYDQYDDMLDEAEPDLLSVATPTSTHRNIALACMQRGVHVLVEKPIAATVAEGEELVAAAGQHGVLLTVGHIERFNPAVRALRARLDTGALGKVFQITARRLGPFPPRITDVGVVVDLATHDLDIMRFLLGDDVERVQAVVTQRLHAAHEDMVTALLHFKGQTLGVLDINWLTPTKVRELTLTGERGMFQVNYLSQELTFYENQSAAGGWDTLSVLMGVSEGNATRLSVERREPLMVELDAFVHAVREGGAPPVPPRDALASLALATAILRAGHTGEVVRPGLALESGANHRAEG